MLIHKFKLPYTGNESLSPKLLWNKFRLRLRFEESCLKQEDITPFIPNNVVILFIVYELHTWSKHLNAELILNSLYNLIWGC